MTLLAGLLLWPAAGSAQSADDIAFDKGIDPNGVFPVVDAHKYPNTMTVTAQATLEGQPLGKDAIIAVFAGDEIRGKECPVNDTDKLAYLTIYGESATFLTFKVWYNDSIYDCREKLEFKSDESLGSSSGPYAITLVTDADGSLTPPVAKTDLVYTGTKQDLVTAGSSETGTMLYSFDGKTYGTDIPQGMTIGEYTVYFRVEGYTGYKDVDPDSIKVSIAPKAITVTADNQTKTADEDDPKLTATVKGLCGEDQVTYTLSREEGNEVGTYKISVTGEEVQGNYTVSFVEGTFTITTAPVVDKEDPVTIDDQTFYKMTDDAKEDTRENIQTDLILSSEASASATVTDDGTITFAKGSKDADIAIPNATKGQVLTVTFDGVMTGKKSQLERINAPAATRGSGDADEDIELISEAEYEVLEDGDIILTLKLEEAPAEIESITLVTPEPIPTYSIKIGSNGKSTFCGDEGLDFSGSDEVKAFIATGYDKTEGIIWMTRVMDVPAGVPVVIKGEADKTYEIPITDGGTSYYENMFVGNTTGKTVMINATEEDEELGTLQNYYMKGGQFMKVNGTANIGPNKCYLQLPATFEEATTGEAFKVKIAASGKSSFAAPYDLDFTELGDDVKAFTATGYDASSKTIWLTRVRKVQQGEGLLLKGTAGQTYTIPSASVQANYVNMFVGNISGEDLKINEESDDEFWTNYYLKKGTYMSVSGSANIGNNKSYLQLPTSMLAGTTGARSEDALSSSDVLGDLGTQENLGDLDNLGIPSTCHLAELETESMPIVFGSIGGDDETTGIKDNNRETITNNRDGQWYTISGQRIDKPTKKGLYIHDGRKVVVK